MRRCTFILMPKERGLKTEFIKKKCVGGLYKTFLRTDRQTDGQNPILIGSLLRDLNSLKNHIMTLIIRRWFISMQKEIGL